ncbi:MAG: hypothetical protein J5636_01065 [Clostridiales bacterium]|nr:hypothetical protein [Clostridiales bacterium]
MRPFVALLSNYAEYTENGEYTENVRILAFITIFALCLLAIGAIILLFTRLLEKSNDYGDEDTLGLRSGDELSKNIGSSLGSDLAVGSLHSMKNFRVDEVSRK